MSISRRISWPIAAGPGRSLGLVGLTALGAGCSYFSQTVNPDTRNRIHQSIQIGMAADEAEATLSGFNFTCVQRTGDYTAENGREHSAEHLLQCVSRPGNISFKCENRDQVFVVLKGGVVDDVEVIRGPNCEQP